MSKPIAEELAKKQKEISVSEFFERNKHILGFDSGTRALITSVKEAVDNALDACEEASILPEIEVSIQRASAAPRAAGATQSEELVLSVEDNGPGIVKRQIGNIFARLLYGSRFHAIRQSRGQQGIGISAVVMYGQLTTGRPAIIESKIGPEQPTIRVHLKMDTKKNQPDFVKEEVVHWTKPHGTKITVHLVGKYQRGPQSVLEYLRSTAIVNPHARLTFKEPDGTTTIFERATETLPAPTQEIKPHPEGIELGTLLKMAKHTQTTKVVSFLVEEFTRVGYRTAREICEFAEKELSPDERVALKGKALEDLKPEDLDVPHAKALLASFKKVKIQAPPTDCLSPIGEVLVKKGVRKELPDTEFIATTTRPANVYSGNPFQVECGIAYGGSLPKDEPVRIIRFANRVPLLYQKGACVSTNAVENIDWRRYELEQRGGKGIPVGPAIILVHVCSTNVPFTSEAKEAIADIEVVQNEVQLALRDCARKLAAHLRKRQKLSRMKEKEALIRKLIPKIAEKSASILGRPVPDYEPVIARIMNNMMITDEIKYNAAGKRHSVTIRATNYCNFGKTFELFSAVPHGVRIEDVDPKPERLEDGLVMWHVKRIPSGKFSEFRFTLVGLDAGDYDETDLYTLGIDDELVSGAEPWKGKGANPEREEPVERMTSSGGTGEFDVSAEAEADAADNGRVISLKVKDSGDRKTKAPAKAAKKKRGE